MTDAHQEQVNIRDLTLDKGIQVRSHLDEDAVQRYKACFDALPPVEVVKTPEGALLADGFHRVAAAKQLGHIHITANVHSGTREDAEEIALTSNTTHGVPLTRWEREAAILRLHELHPEWSNREIARRMAVSEGTVRNLLRNHKIRVELKESGVTHADDLGDTVRAQIYAAPPEVRPELAEAAYNKRWTAEQVGIVAETLANPELPEANKRLVLAGVLPSPHAREEEEQKEQGIPAAVDKLLNHPDRGSTHPYVTVVRKSASHALLDVLDKLLTQEPRRLVAVLDKQEHALWSEYLLRMRRWMDEFEDAASEHDTWVLDDTP